MARLTTEQFIQRARKVHGNKYDYSQVIYLSAIEKVRIVCREHGTFSQGAHDHLNGNGCPKCGCLKNAQKRTKSLKAFIADARRVHGQRYDYSRVVYKLSRSEVTIVCAKHGAFSQTAYDHLRGCGCPKCGLLSTKKQVTKSLKEFIADATQSARDSL